MNIYVGNLNYKVREDDLERVISEFGEVESVKVIKDRETGRSKGFAFVEMPDEKAAQAVIEELNGKDLDGRTMVVKEARPKDWFPPFYPKKNERGRLCGRPLDLNRLGFVSWTINYMVKYGLSKKT